MNDDYQHNFIMSASLILNLIVRRKLPYVLNGWVDRNTEKCLICDRENSFNGIYEHTLFHIKEYNLLAFI
jgi:hypothetical protein